MIRKILLDQKILTLEVDVEGDLYRFKLTGPDQALHEGEERQGEASVREVEPGIFSVLLGGRSYEARLLEDGMLEDNNGLAIEIRGRRFPVEVQNPRDAAPKAEGPVLEGRHTLKAPMPGKVVRILAREGESVEAGCGVLVIEAMKMQNELKSQKSGVVVSLPAAEGDNVSAGDVLAIIE
ncbi:MAG: biotin/lipoyl-containing protein [Bryobacteraceae bacterium]